MIGKSGLWIILFLGLGWGDLAAQVSAQAESSSLSRSEWIRQTYEGMSTRERIGQLFMVAAYSAGKDANAPAIRKLLDARQIGGLIFMQGNAEAQARLTNEFQSMAQVPLLIGMDAEWGLGMRLTGVRDLPRQMMIGATRDTSLAYALGEAVARQCRLLGVHLNFAPVVDVNNNPQNPIINARSFGEDKEWVARLGLSYMRGMQDHGVMACAKHFPGHGDTDKDSHKDLPTIRKSSKQLEDLEFYPFQTLIDGGVQSIMVAHLEVPALEKTPGLPTTLSASTIRGLLREKMGFKGLIITDALNMQGVARYFPPGEVDLRAFQAGNDILLFSQDVPVAIDRIEKALRDGEIDPWDLEVRVKKILAAKYDLGLHRWEPLKVEGISEDLNRDTPELRRRMASAAITLAWDQEENLPGWISGQGARVYLGLNSGQETTLFRELKRKWPDLEGIWLSPQAGPESIARALARVKEADMALLAVHNLRFYPSGGRYGLPSAQMNLLRQLQEQDQVILALMGNAYLLKELCGLPSVLVAYEDEDSEQWAMARVLRGEAGPRGELPVSPCPDRRPRKTGATLPGSDPPAGLEAVEFPQDMGLANPRALDSMRLFVQRCIAAGAFPGAQVVAVHKGKLIVDEALGYQTFDKSRRIGPETLYDLASLTKILSTNLAIMRLYESGKLGLEDSLGKFLSWTRGTDKGSLRVGDLLRHEAGLQAWIPFYKATLNGKDPDPRYYRNQRTEDFSIPVARDLFLRKDYLDTVWKLILESPLENRGKYVYSDLDYFFLAALVEEITGQSLYGFVYRAFYQAMGLARMGYLPLGRFEAEDIAPTELDIYFRHQLIQGYVHDQAAAMFGGIAGHAGLFSNAREVAALMQMLIQKGQYQGKRYFRPETVETFTRYHSRISRRALGFDKPAPDPRDGGPCSPYASGYSFGHQGFTGTCTWADPEHDLVFVFLSNRVYPSADNKNIYRYNARIEVQNFVYRALGIPLNTGRKQIWQRELASRL